MPLKVRAEGRDLSELLAIIDVAIPRTRRYALTAQMVKDDETYRFTGMKGRSGNPIWQAGSRSPMPSACASMLSL
ncbi:hypothetical protein ACFSHP_08735 [Novosphingobium panipatense]